jgi:signal transduction histidine kinase
MLSLFGLYVFTTTIAGRDVINLDRARVLKSATGEPVGNFLGQLDTERLFAVMYLAAPSGQNLARLQAEESKTDRTAAALRAALTSRSTVSNASPAERQANTILLTAAAGLPQLRSRVKSQAISRQQALAAYNAVAGDAYLLLDRVILQEPSAPIVAQALTLVRMGKVEEIVQQENAILAADMAARGFPPADAHQFTELAGTRRSAFSQTLTDLDPAYRAFYTHDVSPRAAAALTSLENTVINNPHPGGLPPVGPAAWQQAVRGFATGLERAGAQASASLDSRAVSEARITELRLALAGGIGLLAVAASILVSLLVGRGLVRELTALSQSAHELADRQLPDVVRRLAAGQKVDVPTGDLGFSAKSDEIREVRDAFAKVRQTAVEAAVGQARLREGMSEVFRKLARRSQSLLHRQLTLLDSMERRARDPHLLEDLFRADHLTTRMRRNAENLIILSGHEPARGWRQPVPLVDVLLGAVAEVEDYTRIKVIASSGASLAGRAVGDVIHMIAELAENATAFAPPNTPVVMTGDVVGQGFAVEIEDRGLGMSAAKLAEVNDRLANPPSFDLSSADQLGLFVAGQLAKRHDIQIHLRLNPYGGATAIVLIPRGLVVPDEEGAEQGQPNGSDTGGQVKGRHATAASGGASATGADPAAAPSGAAPAGTSRDGTFSAGGASAGGASPGADLPSLDQAGLAVPGKPDLPRRVRQASLADQLRNGVPLSAPLTGDPPTELRSPEQTRTTMAAMQHGWERGRSVFDPLPSTGDTSAGETGSAWVTSPGPPSAGWATSPASPGPPPAGWTATPGRPPAEWGTDPGTGAGTSSSTGTGTGTENPHAAPDDKGRTREGN